MEALSAEEAATRITMNTRSLPVLMVLIGGVVTQAQGEGVHLMTVNLSIRDTPLAYTPPVGQLYRKPSLRVKDSPSANELRAGLLYEAPYAPSSNTRMWKSFAQELADRCKGRRRIS